MVGVFQSAISNPTTSSSTMDQVDVLVLLDRALCLSLPSALATVAHVKRALQQRVGVPAASLELSVNGRRLLSEASPVPHAPVVVRARQTGGLLGGKGGFGAMLRSMGKGSGAKATTDFGACRDLHGRRLRHVNQEIAMLKWREGAAEREKHRREGVTEREVMDEDTPSGIPGWFLATPSWADGVKKSYMKRRRNTALCRNWQQARANGRSPPPNAPRWWGCPRGRDCDFAHGEEELRGAGLTELKRAKKRDAQQDQQRELQAYVDYEKEVADDVADAIQQGLRRRKQLQRKSAADSSAATEEEPKAAAPAAVTTKNDSDMSDWLVPFGSDSDAGHKAVHVTFGNGLCELRGRSNFGTAAASADARLSAGKWYYEVRLVTDGVAQLGWADTPAFIANSETGDGVGDHARSWAYDGRRRLKWSGGKEEEYGDVWRKNDVIGCLLDADNGVISFSRNGESLGDAFSAGVVLAGAASAFVPAISLEQAEILLINIGAQPLLYLPVGYRAVSESIDRFPREATTKESDSAMSAKITTATSKLVKSEKPKATPISEPEDKSPLIDLDAVDSVEALMDLGLDKLKSNLRRRGLKCGYVILSLTSSMVS